MKTTLYNIPSSEIPLLREEFGAVHYWSDASEYFHRWDTKLEPTQTRISEPLTELLQANITGTVIINGVWIRDPPPRYVARLFKRLF